METCCSSSILCSVRDAAVRRCCSKADSAPPRKACTACSSGSASRAPPQATRSTAAISADCMGARGGCNKAARTARILTDCTMSTSTAASTCRLSGRKRDSCSRASCVRRCAATACKAGGLTSRCCCFACCEVLLAEPRPNREKVAPGTSAGNSLAAAAAASRTIWPSDKLWSSRIAAASARLPLEPPWLGGAMPTAASDASVSSTPRSTSR
mmetsp:Transcript_137361/g.342568  ORF Transcript_137361/g.342568 Transcript_137361/m.342568 type:complete len:212 (-) Transcript_137361:1146-1781(-)